MGEPLCYWDIKNLPDALLASTFIVIVLFIFIISLLRMRSIKKYKQHMRIARIYVLIAFWAVVFVSQLLYGVSVYFFVILGAEPTTTEMEVYSRSYTRIDIIPGFIVQTLFLQICKLYYGGLTNSIEISRLASWEINFIKWLKCYCIVRVFTQSAGVLLVNIFTESQLLPLFLKINVLILIGDCCIINVMLLVSLRIYMVRFRQTGRIYESDLAQLRQEYSIMIMTSLLRIVIDVLFLVLPIVDQDSQGRCVGYVDGHLIRTIFYNCVANIINHVMPIACFLKIYSFKALEKKQNHQSSESTTNPLVKSILD